MHQPTTYLNFDGNCREAMTFYQRCLGGELTMMPFSEMPGGVSKEIQNRLMHARLSKGSTVLLMASDTMPGSGMPFREGNNFWIMVPCESIEEIDGLFATLGENGKVVMPLQNTFWAARFGMLTDQFGINWMFNFENV